MPDGIGHVVMGNYEFDVEVVGQTTMSTYSRMTTLTELSARRIS